MCGFITSVIINLEYFQVINFSATTKPLSGKIILTFSSCTLTISLYTSISLEVYFASLASSYPRTSILHILNIIYFSASLFFRQYVFHLLYFHRPVLLFFHCSPRWILRFMPLWLIFSFCLFLYIQVLLPYIKVGNN